MGSGGLTLRIGTDIVREQLPTYLVRPGWEFPGPLTGSLNSARILSLKAPKLMRRGDREVSRVWQRPTMTCMSGWRRCRHAHGILCFARPSALEPLRRRNATEDAWFLVSTSDGHTRHVVSRDGPSVFKTQAFAETGRALTYAVVVAEMKTPQHPGTGRAGYQNLRSRGIFIHPFVESAGQATVCLHVAGMIVAYSIPSSDWGFTFHSTYMNVCMYCQRGPL